MYRLAALFLILLTVSSMVAADALYKWVDDKGIVHYSDKPQPGAKKIVLPKASTFNPALAMPPQTSATDSDHRHRAKASSTSANPVAAASYTAIAISSPKNQDTLWNADSVTVSIATTPAWQSGGSAITITVDGQSQTVNGTSASFSGLDRGQHTATATIGGLAASPVTFFIQKTTAIKPPMH